MPKDLKVSQIGSSPLPPPFRGLHSLGVRKHCQIIFTCYFRKSSVCWRTRSVAVDGFVETEVLSSHCSRCCTGSGSHLTLSLPRCHLKTTSKSAKFESLKPVLKWANVYLPNILRTVWRTMICFLIEVLVRRIWFRHSKLCFVLNWLVMRCKLRPELAADSQQTAWSKM